MATTVIGLFESQSAAEKARNALKELGCSDSDFTIVSGSADLSGPLSRQGFEDDEIQHYTQAVRQGRTVLALSVDGNQADRAVDIMRQHGVLPEQERPEQESGGQEASRQETLKEVREEVSVGKRHVLRGGVRVHTRVIERPVEERVSLQEERVDVERRPVERTLSPEEAEQAFQEKSIEMHETAEQAELRKAARLIGEVNVTKTTQTHEETVRGTARETRVEVEDVSTDAGRTEDEGKSANRKARP